MLPEKMAKTKWCPMVRMSVKTESGRPYMAGNRPFHKIDGNCIASDCMMWRWYEDLIIPINGGETYPSVMKSIAEDNKDRNGYCGLAGGDTKA